MIPSTYWLYLWCHKHSVCPIIFYGLIHHRPLRGPRRFPQDSFYYHSHKIHFIINGWLYIVYCFTEVLYRRYISDHGSSARIRGLTFRKAIHFIFTASRTSNPLSLFFYFKIHTYKFLKCHLKSVNSWITCAIFFGLWFSYGRIAIVFRELE